MMAKVTRLDGREVDPQNPERNEEIAAFIDGVAKQNDAGELSAIFYVKLKPGGGLTTGWTARRGDSHVSAAQVLGAIELLKHDAMHSMASFENDVEPERPEPA